MLNLENKKVINRFISINLSLAIMLGMLSSNCFAMRRAGRCGFNPSVPGFLEPPRHFIGPPRPSLPHTKYCIMQNRVASFSESWLGLGIDISAAAFAGTAVGKKAIEVSLQKIGSKGQAVILSSIMKAYGAIPGLESAARKAVVRLAV